MTRHVMSIISILVHAIFLVMVCIAHFSFTECS